MTVSSPGLARVDHDIRRLRVSGVGLVARDDGAERLHAELVVPGLVAADVAMLVDGVPADQVERHPLELEADVLRELDLAQ